MRYGLKFKYFMVEICVSECYNHN